MWLDRWLLGMIEDPRDLRVMHVALAITFTVIPFAIYLFVAPHFPWWLGGLYLALVIGVFLDRYTLMLHVTSHRRLFNAKYHSLRNFIPVILGPFFGQPPWGYHAHHVGMHHVEGNLPADLSSTMRFRRDSFIDFLRYFGRFFFAIAIELPRYFFKRGKVGLGRRALFGELGFDAFIIVGLIFNLQATLVVFVIPLFVIRFLMMAGNWGQHAFVDPADPASPYRNTITCINSPYNARCFNDGYHISHHLKPTRHWSEHPQELIENEAEYAKNEAFVLTGTDFFIVWLMLMLKRHRWIASRLVPLAGVEKSVDERLAMIEARLVPIVSSEATSPDRMREIRRTA